MPAQRLLADRYRQAFKMKRILAIFLFILTCLYLFSQDNEKNYFLKGKITAVLGTKAVPVSESVVELTGERTEITQTNDNGEFEFIKLEKGQYRIKVIAYYGEIDSLVIIENRNIKDFDFVFLSDCEINSEIAKQDLKNGKPRLLIYGGIAPVEYTNQHIFEEKYHIEYFSYGCISPPYNCVLEYNQLIFDYLTDNYGKKWKREVRKDVVGIKKKKAWR